MTASGQHAIAFVGCGRITRAMVRGLLAAGHAPELLRGVSRTGAGARALAAEFGIRSADSLAQAVRDAPVVVLAVHPHETAAVLAGLAGVTTPEQMLLSLVASWRTEAVAKALPGVPVVRAVPNVAIAVREGVTVLGEGAGVRHLDTAHKLFAGLGRVILAEEDQLEAVSALSGAGPALVAYFANALAAAGAAHGMSEEMAATLAGHAVRGTGSLLAGGVTPASVIASVTSPGGMTEAALRTLDACALPESTRRAVDAAVRLSFARLVTA
ncbi:pyrroline-5-carboxylate reductase family protein [Streptomyces sp. NPDC002104]